MRNSSSGGFPGPGADRGSLHFGSAQREPSSDGGLQPARVVAFSASAAGDASRGSGAKRSQGTGSPSDGRTGLRVSVHSQVDGQTAQVFFRDFPIRIGRNKLNDLVLNHPYVSQWHAVIGAEQSGLSITQVGSTNAVKVGERKLLANEEVPLRGNEVIRIVPYDLTIRVESDPANFPSVTRADEHSIVAAAADARTSQTARATIALQILNRLSQRLLGRTFEDPRDLALFGARIEESLEVFLRCFIALKRGQDQLRSALDIRALAPDSHDPVQRSEDATQLAQVLLSPARSGTASLERSFKDLMIHQVALLNGTMAGVRNLLSKIGPKAIRKEAGKKQKAPSSKSLWETFERLHRDLSEEEEATFETVFGRHFDRAYAKVAGKK
jgi:predicted component of type VI protein secretion system